MPNSNRTSSSSLFQTYEFSHKGILKKNCDTLRCREFASMSSGALKALPCWIFDYSSVHAHVYKCHIYARRTNRTQSPRPNPLAFKSLNQSGRQVYNQFWHYNNLLKPYRYSRALSLMHEGHLYIQYSHYLFSKIFVD